MASQTAVKMNRDDYKKEKELDEARKAGTAPALVDESGKDINPHIPQYISKTPWYIPHDGPTLKHQRFQEDKIKETAKLDVWYSRGATQGPAATKYRKGACENCGAMTHSKIDCLARPRRVGAKFTNNDIMPDEVVNSDPNLGFDGKRDRWNGYDPREYRKVVEEYEKIDQEKRRLKAEQLEKELEKGPEVSTATAATKPTGLPEEAESSSDDDDEQDDEKGYADNVDAPGQKFDVKNRNTVRNLRIREDTAKYLRNLDINSAHYDPKTRTMRSNPYAKQGKDPSELPFAGDNFIRYSGDVSKIAQQQLFAWEATDKGSDIHVLADPTKAELMHREFRVKKETFKDSMRDSILAKYGGEEHLDAPPMELLLAQTESYIEYSKFGHVIKGQEKTGIRSRYEEDVHPGNHKSVWGSFWQNGRWGYACCHSVEKHSYCVGDKGKTLYSEPLISIEPRREEGHVEAEEGERKSLMQRHQEGQRESSHSRHGEDDEEAADHDGEKGKAKRSKTKKSRDKTDDHEDSEKDAKKRIEKALRRQEQEDREADALLEVDERARPYNSLKRSHQAPTEDEMEAYRMKRRNMDDPMKSFVDTDD